MGLGGRPDMGLGGRPDDGDQILYSATPTDSSSRYYESVCWYEVEVTLTPTQLAQGHDRIAQLATALAGEDGCVHIRGDVFNEEYVQRASTANA